MTKAPATRMVQHVTSPCPVQDRPRCRTFEEYLNVCARVPRHGDTYGPFCFEGRAPLRWIVALTDKVLLNCLGDGQPKPRQDANHAAAKSSTTLRPPTSIGPAARAVEIDGIHFEPGALKGATITIGGGAQCGKTALVLNLLSFLTAIQFANFGYYTPDHELLAKIVDTKFRPDVLDQQPWMAAMIRLGVTKNASGRTVNRKNSFQVSDGQRKAFGHFCGMQKPTTAISLDAAALDEVDDIPSRNIGYVDGRITG